MADTVIERSIVINAPKDKVWAALADFGNVQNLSPNIKKSYLMTDEVVGLGSTRHCDFYSMGASVDEKIVEWNEGESLKIELYNPKNLPMIRDMEATFKVEAKGDQTILSGVLSYGMSGAMGSLMNGLMMKKMNIKSWVSFMAGIKLNVETGTLIEKDTKLDMSGVMG